MTDGEKDRARNLIITAASGAGRRDIKLVIDYLCAEAANKTEDLAIQLEACDVVDGDLAADDVRRLGNWIEALALPESHA